MPAGFLCQHLPLVLTLQVTHVPARLPLLHTGSIGNRRSCTACSCCWDVVRTGRCRCRLFVVVSGWALQDRLVVVAHVVRRGGRCLDGL